ncbi:hypothetical protein AACH10_07890 [Ideonella sp. DXS22W]|uniref:Lipoprotein n=1 Tax=Pseudaquabacterium inlustre TaxID=2984192 RepID=A0ABU9CE42_9BURK
MRRLAIAAALGAAAMACGCGTFTALPAHGGGKRFAIEQALVSAAAKKVIGDLPLDTLRNRRILLETTVVNDEGGGAVNGGRPYLADALSHTVPHARGVTGFTALRNDNTYIKDASFNNSDGRQFANLLASALVRQNVMLNPNPESEGEPEFFVEVIVDVLGTWRSRTDWLVSNTERLQAIVSVEYVISPMKPDGGPRRVGKVGWEAEYRESYVGWMGPAHSDIELRPSALTSLLPTLGSGSDSTSNLQRAKPVEFAQPQPAQPIQVNPRAK